MNNKLLNIINYDILFFFYDLDLLNDICNIIS